MRRISKRKAAVAMLVTGLMTLGAGFSLEGVASANPYFNEAQYDLHLFQPHHGATWASAREGTCERGETPDGYPYLWHFVVPSYPVGGTPDVTAVYAYFKDAGVVTGGNVVQDGKGWNLYTAAPDTLIDAVGDSTATEEKPVRMNLSHTCGPNQSSSSSSSSSLTSSSSSSSTTSSSSSSTTSSTSTIRTTFSSSTSSSSTESSSSETSSSEASVLPSSIVNSSSAAPSSQASVSGVVVTRQLPRTGFDPGLLLMLGGMLVVSGVLMLRYADDRI